MLTKKRKVIYSLLAATLLTTSVGYAENISTSNVNCNLNNNPYSGRGYTIKYNNNSNIGQGNVINKYPDFILDIINKSVVKPDVPVTKPDTPVTKPEAPVTKPETPIVETPSVSGLSAVEMEVVRLVNIERQKGGLAPFTASSELSNVARKKSEDMATNNYFSHTSPTYGSPFDMMKSFGIKYNTAGENIAKGQASAQSVVTGWMNSPGHRDNIMNPSFNKIGVGLYKSSNGTNLWTQMFTN